MPCNDCTTCQSPILCSWSSLGCDEPALSTQECTKSGCSNQLHYICQIKHQEANNLQEEMFCCYYCHERVKSLQTSSTQHTQCPSLSAQSNYHLPPTTIRHEQLPMRGRQRNQEDTGRLTRSQSFQTNCGDDPTQRGLCT